MSTLLENPGDTLEGQGVLLQHGRWIAPVGYHLAIPGRTHFVLNHSAGAKLNYGEHAGGFVLVPQVVAASLKPASYILELADKRRLEINVTRPYKEVTHQGQPHVSFWVTVIV